jgi:dienelactone hydrolase
VWHFPELPLQTAVRALGLADRGSRPTYRKPEAEDGWKHMQEWFKANGV